MRKKENTNSGLQEGSIFTCSPKFVSGLGLLVTLIFMSSVSFADRYILSPRGSTLDPNGIKSEFLMSPSRGNENYSWLQISSGVGIEMEYNRFDQFGDGKIRNSFNVQYPILSDLGQFPAISVGIRDLLGTGQERQSLYFVIGKDLPLSQRQLGVVREVNVSIGGGMNYLSGPTLGARVRLRSGATFTGEYFRYRFNGSVSVPLIRHFQGNVSSLNGQLFYGLTYTFAP